MNSCKNKLLIFVLFIKLSELTIAAVPGVVPVQDHEEGRHDQEQDVGGGVDELGNVRGEGVVVLAPVDGTRAPLQVSPHLGSHPAEFTDTCAWSHRDGDITC